MAPAAAAPRAGLLCLHGSRQTGEIFRTRLDRLSKKLNDQWELVFPDGPHPLPLEPGDDVPLRSWFAPGEAVRMEEDEEDVIGGLEKIWRGGGRFEAILGFSQGAGLAALIASKHITKFPGLKFVVACGAPDSERISCPTSTPLPRVLFTAGQADTAVPLASTESLARKFPTKSTLLQVHDGGHSLPKDLSQIVDLLMQLRTHIKESVYSCESTVQEQCDELEALQAIFSDPPDAVGVDTPPALAGPPASLSIALTCDPSAAAELPEMEQLWCRPIGGLRIKIQLPTDGYPSGGGDAVPTVGVATGAQLALSDFPGAARASLLACLRRAARDNVGTASIYAIVLSAQDWLVSQKWRTDASADDPAQSEAEAETAAAGSQPQQPQQPQQQLSTSPQWFQHEMLNRLDEAVTARAIADATRHADEAAAAARRTGTSIGGGGGGGGGAWTYRVALVGKPSAGKSTFFNAITRAVLEREGRKAAACSPHPFTTIEPNVATGFFRSFETDDTRDGAPRGARFGRCPATNRRLLPCVIYDIAGLVPGAYQGRGKGNKFLNDILDADVILHVTDTSGRSDRDGNILTSQQQQQQQQQGEQQQQQQERASTPLEDAEWVREEMHRWIANNILYKWSSVARTIKHLGKAAQQTKAAARVYQLFTGYHAPRECVDEAARRAGLDLTLAESFVLADVHLLVAHFLKVRFPIALALNKIDLFVDSPGSAGARAGLEVVEACRCAVAARGEVAVPCSALAEGNLLSRILHARGDGPPPPDAETALTDAVLGLWGSSGVLEAISAAVSLRPPLLVYPVEDLDSEAEVGGGSDAPERLPDCIILKPGSTVMEAFEALKRGSLSHVRLTSEFVRAEGRGLDTASRRRVLGRDAVLGPDCNVLKLSANKKSAWQ